MLISLPTFGKYNGRPDVKNSTWFRLNNDFLSDETIFDANTRTKLIWIHLIGTNNRAREPQFRINLELTAVLIKCTAQEVRSSLLWLADRGKIIIHVDDIRDDVTHTLRARNVDVTPAYPTDRQTDRQTDITSSPPSAAPPDDLPKKETPKGPSPKDLAEVWNAECRGAMAKVLDMKPGTKRWNSAKARLADESDLEVWRMHVRKVADSPFVRGEVEGRNGGKPWRGNFDWFIRPDTVTKIVEGLYDRVDTRPREQTFVGTAFE